MTKSNRSPVTQALVANVSATLILIGLVLTLATMCWITATLSGLPYLSVLTWPQWVALIMVARAMNVVGGSR